MTQTRLYCTFRLADLFLGVEVCRVQEVLRYQDMTDVPLTSPVISGLINLRGQIVTAIDLRRRFGLPARGNSEEQRPMNVVVRTDEGVVSLLVDSIGDVLEVREEAYEPPPPTMNKHGRDLVSGVYKLDDDLLLVLDIERTLDINASASASAHDSAEAER